MAFSAAERVKRSRWVNRVEEVADQLLSLLRQAPEPLPRSPVFDPELFDRIAAFTPTDDVTKGEDFPVVRFLQLGNGHQARNRDKALRAFAALVPKVKVVDKQTVEVDGMGPLHFAAYTHLKGAMISSTRAEDRDFGGAEWHSKSNMVLFRDAGDGRCIAYFAPIEPLLELRTIGQHGVKWEDVRKVALRTEVLRSADAIRATE